MHILCASCDIKPRVHKSKIICTHLIRRGALCGLYIILFGIVPQSQSEFRINHYIRRHQMIHKHAGGKHSAGHILMNRPQRYAGRVRVCVFARAANTSSWPRLAHNLFSAQRRRQYFYFLRREVGARRERALAGIRPAASISFVCVIRDASSNYKTRSLRAEIPFVISELREIFLGNAKECARDKLFMELNKISLQKHIKSLFKFSPYRWRSRPPRMRLKCRAALPRQIKMQHSRFVLCCEIDTAELMKVECFEMQPCVTSPFLQLLLEKGEQAHLFAFK